MATKQTPPPVPQPQGKVSVRVLSDGPYGRVNDVVELDAADVVAAKEHGYVDDNEAAVAYARSLTAPGTDAALE